MRRINTFKKPSNSPSITKKKCFKFNVLSCLYLGRISNVSWEFMHFIQILKFFPDKFPMFCRKINWPLILWIFPSRHYNFFCSLFPHRSCHHEWGSVWRSPRPRPDQSGRRPEHRRQVLDGIGVIWVCGRIGPKGKNFVCWIKDGFDLTGKGSRFLPLTPTTVHFP